MADDAASVRDGDTPARARSLPLRVASLLIGLAFLVHARQWDFLCDDAYIGFRYARNLARHGSLVFNVDPLERVEGYTNLLWVLILAAGDFVGVSPPSLAPVLTALASAVGLVCVCALVRRLRERCRTARAPGPIGLVDAVPAAILVALPEYVVWASGGLETSFALALSLAAMLAWVRDRMVLAAALAACAGCTRLDALLPIASFGAAWLGWAAVARVRAPGPFEIGALPWRRIGLAALVFVAPLAAQFAWRHAYYGEWLPNTWAIKRHGALLRDTVGRDYLSSWLANLHLLGLMPLAIMLRPRHALLVVPVAATLAYAWSVGGDFMAYSRFLLPATALVAGLAGWLLADLQAWAFARGRSIPIGVGLGTTFAVALAWTVPKRVDVDERMAWVPIDLDHEQGRWEGVHGMDEFARVRVAAGTWMREHLPADTLISVGAAGALPYASELPAFDVYGLVDPEVARVSTPTSGEGARPGHQLEAPWSYVRAREPDLVCHLGRVGARRPSPGSARHLAGPGWVWACIELGTLTDARGSIDAGYYCCLRESKRVVGPFGAEGPG